VPILTLLVHCRMSRCNLKWSYASFCSSPVHRQQHDISHTLHGCWSVRLFLMGLYVFLADTVQARCAFLRKVLITRPNTAIQICYSSLLLHTACRIYFFYIYIYCICTNFCVSVICLMTADLDSRNILLWITKGDFTRSVCCIWSDN
jgi:hypothetical protein